MNRIITLQGSFSDNDVRFRSLRGREALSALYEFELEVLCPSYNLDIKQTLGTALNLSIELAKGAPRRLGGKVTGMELVGRESGTSRDYLYRLTVRPWLWFLSCTSDCKIFQKKTVVEILDEVFSDYDYPLEKRLKSSYRQWEYCVQYQETDFNFVSRLMEQEGIYYFFRHDEAGETLVLTDDISAHQAIPGNAELPYLPPDRLVNGGEIGVSSWQAGEEIRPGSYMVGDYDFSKPKADMRQLQSNPQRHANDQYEMYDWMGGFIDQADAENYSRIRLEEAQCLRERTRAQSQMATLEPGFTFTLSGHPRVSENRAYLIVSADYDFREGGYASGSEQARYDTRFVVQPDSLPYRAPRRTPLPFTHGPQTAVVVGPQGEEIWTDLYGRVKVQFHWDRYGQKNENSSCWVRVSSHWAGSNFGGLQIPRIGQEVVVDFINGLPDRPLIVGRVYNADQMPPFALPDSRTQSGIVTRSFEQGSVENANILRFDDKRGAEQILLHAERDLDTSVERNETLTVNQNRAKLVAGSESNTVSTNQSNTVAGTTTNQHNVVNSTTGISTSVTGAAFGATGAQNEIIGSMVEVLGSFINNSGSYIANIGSQVATTGSSITTTGSSISTTGVSISHVGYSVTN